MLKTEEKKEVQTKSFQTKSQKEQEVEKTSSSLVVRSEEKKLSGLDGLWNHIKEYHIKELKDRKDDELEKKIDSLTNDESAGFTLENFLDYLLDSDKKLSDGEKDKFRKAKSILEKKIEIYKENYDRKKTEDNDIEYIKTVLNDKTEELLRIKLEIKELEEFKEKELSSLKNDEERLEYIKSSLKFILKVDKGNREAAEELRNLEMKNEKEKLDSEKKQLENKLKEKEEEIKKLKEDLSNAESERVTLQRKLDKRKEEEKEKQFKEAASRAEEAEKEAKEWKEKFMEMSRNANKRDFNINVENKNENTTSAFASSQVNMVIFPIQYDKGLEKKEKKELGEDYQKLEESNEELPSNQQKLKKTILFLGAKQIFATTRQDTINNLIRTYENTDKSGKRYDKIALVGDYISDAGEIASIVPGGDIVVKVLSKGIPVITKLLKSRSLTIYSQEFGNYLIEDEKALLLLQQTYQSLVASRDNNRGKISSVLDNLLKFNTDQFIQHSVFEVSKLPKGGKITSEEMSQVIKLLTEYLKEFVQELRQETNQYTEKMEEIFATEEGKILQTELTELLERLSGEESGSQELSSIDQPKDLQGRIESKEIELQSLVAEAKNKLKSTHWLEKEKRNKGREEMINNFLSIQEEIVRLGNNNDRRKKLVSLQKELLEIANEHGHKEFKELNDLCQFKKELTQLQIEREQQAQIGVPPKGRNQ